MMRGMFSEYLYWKDRGVLRRSFLVRWYVLEFSFEFIGGFINWLSFRSRGDFICWFFRFC